MAPPYLFDWNKVYTDNENSTFFQRVNKYLEEYSNNISNPKDIIDLMKFMQRNNISLEEKYKHLKRQTIKDLYKIVQNLTSQF